MPDLPIGLWRMVTAAHELGHAVFRRDCGVQLASIRIWGQGQFMRGEVQYRSYRVLTATQMREYIVGALMGEVAGNRWRLEHAPRLPEDSSPIDLANVRRAMRHKLATGLDLVQLRQQARLAVLHRWPEIARLTPRLAERGSLLL